MKKMMNLKKNTKNSIMKKEIKIIKTILLTVTTTINIIIVYVKLY